MDTYESIRGARDFLFEVSRGLYENVTHVNKFGRSTNVDNGINTDIWDRANVTNDQDIWIAPTVARTHNIVSSSANDVFEGRGARTIRVFGLTSWDTEEVFEDIAMNGIADVPTVNDYVIIYRMQVLSKGPSSANIGLITATAVGDGTVSAQIEAGKGQTQMAIYGVPSIQNAYMYRLYANFNKLGAELASVDIELLVNPEPKEELANFLTKHSFGLISTGTSALDIHYKPYKRIHGPAIIKVQGNGNADNLDVSAGFDMILVRES